MGTSHNPQENLDGLEQMAPTKFPNDVQSCSGCACMPPTSLVATCERGSLPTWGPLWGLHCWGDSSFPLSPRLCLPYHHPNTWGLGQSRDGGVGRAMVVTKATSLPWGQPQVLLQHGFGLVSGIGGGEVNSATTLKIKSEFIHRQ